MKFSFEKIPLIYLITRGSATAENFSQASAEILDLVRAAVKSQIPLIQVREKKLPAKLVYSLVSEAVKLTQNTLTAILVNDRADIALAANADGVHLTAQSLPTALIRQNFPANFIIGVSTHTLEEAQLAKAEKADFVTFSPIFNTPSKEIYGSPQGLEKLQEVCEKLNPLPVIALGGINENNFNNVLENGASGFAAIRFLNDVENLKKFSHLKINGKKREG